MWLLIKIGNFNLQWTMYFQMFKLFNWIKFGYRLLHVYLLMETFAHTLLMNRESQKIIEF